MTFSFQNWMQAVWHSIMEPSDAARKVIGLQLPAQVLWTGLALVVVMNVILLSGLQLLTPVPLAFEQSAFVLSPFVYAAIIGIFLVFFVFGTFYVGQMFGSAATLLATLAIIVWFQSISLTLEAVQIVLALISPVIGSLFGVVSLGALLWVFVNFINILHGYHHLGKAILTVIFALLITGFAAGIVMAVLGLGPAGDFS